MTDAEGAGPLIIGELVLPCIVFGVVLVVVTLVRVTIDRPSAWWPALAGSLACAIRRGIVEEVFYRRIPFRIPEEHLGSWLAPPLSAVISGGAHRANPDASARRSGWR